MGLCEHVYRRGGVYRWRRRAGACLQEKESYLRLSLKVRHPQQARELARRVGVEADRLASTRMLAASEQKLLLRTLIDNQVGQLDGVAGLAAHRDADNGSNAEPHSDRVRRDKIMAAVYAALGARGVAARIGDAEAASLAASGFDAGEIDVVREQVEFFRDCLPRIAADGAIDADGPRGLIGPPNAAFRQILGLLDAEATNEHVGQARRLWLQSMSVVLRDADRRHAPLDPGHAEVVFNEMFGQVRHGQQQVRASTLPTKPGVDYTISGQIAAMVETKKGQDWKITKRGVQDVSDSAESYIFLGKILVKMFGIDDVRKIDAETPMQLRQRLQSLPLHYGKARKHWGVSFDEAIANAKKAGKPIGRDGATINKYLNFLQALEAD